MSDFSYRMEFVEKQEEGSPGGKVKLLVKVTEATSEISRVSIAIDMYGIYSPMKKEADDLYSLDYFIPYEAPTGNYEVSLWAVDKDYNKGPVVKFNFLVK